jgi:integrase
VPKKTPLARVAVEALKGLPSYGVDDYVFPSRPTAKWPGPKKPYRWDVGKPFRALVRSLGIEDVRLHDLRHTGPSVLLMLMQGIPGDIVRRPPATDPASWNATSNSRRHSGPRGSTSSPRYS